MIGSLSLAVFRFGFRRVRRLFTISATFADLGSIPPILLHSSNHRDGLPTNIREDRHFGLHFQLACNGSQRHGRYPVPLQRLAWTDWRPVCYQRVWTRGRLATNWILHLCLWHKDGIVWGRHVMCMQLQYSYNDTAETSQCAIVASVDGVCVLCG